MNALLIGSVKAVSTNSFLLGQLSFQSSELLMECGKFIQGMDLLGFLRFATGIPRVGICHTITIPSDTAPVQGKGRNWTLIYAVSYETHGIMNTCGYIVMQITKTLLVSMPHVYYSIISMSDDSLLLFELPFRATRTSSNKMRSFHPQEPRQRKAQMDKAESQLWVNERSWQPCEKTHSTAIDVAIRYTIKNQL